MKADSNTLTKIRRNVISLLGGDFLNKVSTFLVYAMLARHADAYRLGQLSLGLMLLYTFQVFAASGLPIEISRNVARRPNGARRLLIHGYIAVLVPAFLATIAMVLFSHLMGFGDSTTRLILILSFAILPCALATIAEAVIRGREKMHLIVLANAPGNCGMVIAAYIVLSLGFGVSAIGLVIVVAKIITFVCLHCIQFRQPPLNRKCHRIRLAFAWRMLRRSLVFLGSDSVIVIWSSLDALLLSVFATEREIGLLGASFQLLQPTRMFYQCLGHSCFPALCSAAMVSREQVAILSHVLIGFLLRLCIPATVTIWVVAGDALATIYGNEDFRAGAIALRILSLTLLLDIVCTVLGRSLWAMSQEKVVLKAVVINLMISLVIGIVLISRFGLIGAAVSVLLSSALNVFQHCYYFYRVTRHFSIWSELIAILPAALAMMLVVVCAPAYLYLNLLLALIVYFVFAFPKQWYSVLRLGSSRHKAT